MKNIIVITCEKQFRKICLVIFPFFFNVTGQPKGRIGWPKPSNIVDIILLSTCICIFLDQISRKAIQNCNYRP